jgi:hypothetical protein
MHAFAKMSHNVLKFGSSNNFSGNIREQALKGIVEDLQKKYKGNQINLQSNVLYANMKAMLSNML